MLYFKIGTSISSVQGKKNRSQFFFFGKETKVRFLSHRILVFNFISFLELEFRLTFQMVFVSLSPWRLSFSQRHFNKQVPARNFLRQLKRPQILPSASGGDSGLRVFVISDLHTDYSENMRWVKSLSSKRHKKDVLIVAGDVAETFNNFILTMSLLKDRFQHVLFVPGNHDLWCRYEGDDFVRNIISLVFISYECI